MRVGNRSVVRRRLKLGKDCVDGSLALAERKLVDGRELEELTELVAVDADN